MVKLRRPKSNVPPREFTAGLEVYPGYGARLPSGQWRLTVGGVAFQAPATYTARQRMLVRMLAKVMRATPDEVLCDIFQQRVAPFLSEPDHKRRVILTIGDRSYPLHKRTLRNGHFRGHLQLDDGLVQEVGQPQPCGQVIVPYRVHLGGNRQLAANGEFRLIPAGGISVISDIDDTIKVSCVGDRRELLANTFLREFQSVGGMAELYQKWAAGGATFHYVSSSPWQLFHPLQGLHTHLRFPGGTMHLRNFRLRDQLFKKFRIRRHGKVSAIRLLMQELPQQQFVLIGDSGEKDPEIYRKICRRFPDRIRGLFIRDLPHRLMTDERWQKVRSSLPNGIVAGFTDSAGLKQAADGVFR